MKRPTKLSEKINLVKKRNHQKTSINTRDSRQVSGFLDENVRQLRGILGNISDLVIKRLSLVGTLPVAVLFISGMADSLKVNEWVIARLMDCRAESIGQKNLTAVELLNIIKMNLITIQTTESDSLYQLAEALQFGNTVVLLEEFSTSFIVETRKVEKRNIGKPEMETSIFGGKEAFNEDLETNCTLLRKRLPSPDLHFTDFTLGRLSRTKVRLCWVEGIAKSELVGEIQRRISRIDVDIIVSSTVIAELIEDEPLTVFPQYKKTERPDVVVPNLAEGRVAIFCDGFPYALLVPLMLMQELQTIDDYSQKPIIGTLLRFIRYMALFIAIFASPLYLSFVAYNHTIMPPDLALQISSGRENVPFPTAVELILMTLLIDLLREAGIRMPQTLGASISVLGAVVIGQAAVTAGYFSPALIIIISISAISGYAIPSINLANVARFYNFALIIIAALSGIFGVILGAVFIVWRMVSIRSFGVVLTHPVQTGRLSTLKDVFVRRPFWELRKRPRVLAPDNQTRMGGKTQKPSPPDKPDEEA